MHTANTLSARSDLREARDPYTYQRRMDWGFAKPWARSYNPVQRRPGMAPVKAVCVTLAIVVVTLATCLVGAIAYFGK